MKNKFCDNPKLTPHIYTREEISKMTTDEFTKHEPNIMKQLKEKGIPNKKEVEMSEKSKHLKNTKSSSNDGKWVTINGNHILIKD